MSASNEKAEQLLDSQQNGALSSDLDLGSARELYDASDEHRIQPLFLQRFIERAWTACSGTIRANNRVPVFRIGDSPKSARELAQKRQWSLPAGYNDPFALDKQLVSVSSQAHVPSRTRLMGLGHPLLDAQIEWAIGDACLSFAKGTKLVDPNIARPQRIWHVSSMIEIDRQLRWRQDRRKHAAHERLDVIVCNHEGSRTTSPSCILNFTIPGLGLPIPDIAQKSTENIEEFAYGEIIERQLHDIKNALSEELNQYRMDLNTAYRNLAPELQRHLDNLQCADLIGDDDAEERGRIRQRIEELHLQKAKRMKELNLMLNLSASLPEVLTEAMIAPISEASPTVVSRDGERYDVRSEGPGGEKRIIEVQSRAQSGAIVLTGPERDTLHQLGDRAWLYVNTCSRDERPHVNIIQNPILKLENEMQYRQTPFRVEEGDWAQKGLEVTA